MLGPMIVDAHCHLGAELPAQALLRTMDAGGIDRAVLIPAAEATMDPVPKAGAAFFCTCMNVPSLRMPLYRAARRSKRLKTIVRPDNAAVFAAAATSNRFLPFAFVNATLGDEAQDELDRWMSEGARGVKLHLWHHRYRLTDALPVLKRCEAAGIPVLAHLGFGPASDVGAVLDACPKLKLILAHAGVPYFEQLWRLERVMFDVAAAGLLIGNRMIEKLVTAVGPHRVIYGSDAPVGIRRDGAYAYGVPHLPDRAMGANVVSLLD
jgi:predicted TIM-barrel fold metal-dependent hydrolase